MEKNTIWAIVLSSVVLVLFMYLQTIFYPPAPAAVSAAEAAPVVQDSVVPGQSGSAPIFEREELSAADEAVAEEQVVIQTDLIRVTLTNKGGDIVSYELLTHLDKGIPVQMADNVSAANRAFSLSFGASTNAAINDMFVVRRTGDYSVGFFKQYSLKNPDGTTSDFTLGKRYTFDPKDYMFRLEIVIDGEDGTNLASGTPFFYTLRTPPQIGPEYDQKNNRYETRTFMSYTNDKKKKQILGTGQVKNYDNTFSWTGVAGKYFTVLVSPFNTPVTSAVYSTVFENPEYSNAQDFIMRAPLAQQRTQDTYYVYIGPRTEQSLDIYNNAVNNPWNLSGLRLNDSLESTGFWSWLEAFLKWTMELCYKFIPNWGASIIILTILLKLALFPLTKKSSMASLKMQEVQPRMKELQDKFKDQPEKLNAEMAKLYKETGYNPLSGCLPLLIQFPLIFAMYNLFNNYFEFRGAMFIPGWIPDLSVGDSVYTLSFSLPFLGNQIRLLPVIYVISQLLFGKMTQTGATPNNSSMKIMMYGMPLFFFFIFYNAPAGLILYWTVSNVLQLIQQLIINKYMHRKRLEAGLPVQQNVPTPVKKKKR